MAGGGSKAPPPPLIHERMMLTMPMMTSYGPRASNSWTTHAQYQVSPPANSLVARVRGAVRTVSWITDATASEMRPFLSQPRHIQLAFPSSDKMT